MQGCQGKSRRMRCVRTDGLAIVASAWRWSQPARIFSMNRDPKKSAPRASDPLPLEPFIERYWDHLRIARGLSLNTVLAYRRISAPFSSIFTIRMCRMRGCGDASAPVRIFGHLYRSGLASSSRARSLAAVRSLFRFLKQEGKITANPTVSLRSTSRARRLPKTLSLEDVTRLLDVPLRPTAGRSSRSRDGGSALCGGFAGVRVDLAPNRSVQPRRRVCRHHRQRGQAAGGPDRASCSRANAGDTC